MDGNIMEVLNTVQVSGNGFGFILLILTIAAVCYTFTLFDNGVAILGFATAVLSIILMACTIVQFKAPPRTRYEVSFDGDYTVSELIENYEIVDQRGDILIVEEKSE